MLVPALAIADDPYMMRAQPGRKSRRADHSGDDRSSSGPGIGWTKAVPSARAWLVVALTVVALLFGGGGSPAPRPEIIVQLLAALACICWTFLPGRTNYPIDRRALGLAMLILVLPALQLVPLPPLLWQALPGRALEVQSLALVGADSDWMPWTTSPARTLSAFLAMIPAVAAMLMITRLDLAGRRAVMAAIAALGIVSVAVGTLQLAAGPADWVTFYPDSNGAVFGFQANRNAEVDVLLIALVAGVAAFADWARRSAATLTIVAAFVLVMVLGAGLTGSRAGIALMPFALILAAAILLRRGMTLRRIGTGLGVLLGVGVVAAVMLRGNTAIGRVLARFTGTEDFRAELWTDTWYAIGQFWPFGSGLGTIVPVLIGVERLEVVDVTLPNRAHNDYLELVLEGGAFGLLVLAAIAALLGVLAWRAWRGRTAANRPQVLFAVATLIIIALHSIVDYPLRSMALAHLAGVAAGLLIPPLRVPGATDRMRELQA